MRYLSVIFFVALHNLSAQPHLYIGVGGGYPSGTATSEYQAKYVFIPTLKISSEFGYSFQSKNRLSGFISYSRGQKGGLLSNAPFTARYYGILFQRAYFESKKAVFGLGPLLAYGHEKNEWGSGNDTFRMLQYGIVHAIFWEMLDGRILGKMNLFLTKDDSFEGTRRKPNQVPEKIRGRGLFSLSGMVAIGIPIKTRQVQ